MKIQVDTKQELPSALTFLHPRAIEDISAAIQLIASRCDGAMAQDGQGFNRNDADIGHEYAEKTNWTFMELKDCYWLLRKYHRQLEEEGINWKDITAPWGNNENEREKRTAITTVTTKIHVEKPENFEVICPESRTKKVHSPVSVRPSDGPGGKRQIVGKLGSHRHGFIAKKCPWTDLEVPATRKDVKEKNNN